MTIRRGAELGAQIAELNVSAGMLALWALGQSGIIVKSSQTLAVIDPYLSDALQGMGAPEPCFPPPLEPEILRGIDLILCTHEHPDHTDPATLKPLLDASPDAQLVASAQSLKILEDAGIDTTRARVPTLGERYAIADGDYRAIPAAHYQLEIEGGRSRWMGFVLSCGGITLLHSGDTILVPEIYAALKETPIDLALLPINGRDYFREQQDLIGNLLPREAAQFAHEIGAQVLIAIHNDLLPNNRLNPAELWDDLDRRFPRQRCHLLQPGELYLYVA